MAQLDQSVTLADTPATGAAALEWQGDLGAGWYATAGVAAEARTAFPLALAPRAALSWIPVDAVALRASYSEGTRAPDRYDVTALAQTVVDGRVVGAQSNDALLPEHVRMLELSSSYRPSPRLSVDVRAYGLRHEDALDTVVASGLALPTNLAPRLAIGGEATGSVGPFGERLLLDAGVAASRTVDGPSVDADVTQLVAGARILPVDGVTVGVRARAVTRTAGESALADAWGALSLLDDKLRVTLSVRNILDGNELSIDRVAPPQADQAVLLPSPGRVVTVAVEGAL